MVLVLDSNRELEVEYQIADQTLLCQAGGGGFTLKFPEISEVIVCMDPRQYWH